MLFDSNGCIRRYESVEEILREFFAVRMELYHKRKSYLEGILEAESCKLNNQARFIMEKIEGKVVIGEYTSSKDASIYWVLHILTYWQYTCVVRWDEVLCSVIHPLDFQLKIFHHNLSIYVFG